MRMGDRDTIMDMYTRFTHITNELKSLGKTFTTEELVRKILRFLPRNWEAKVTAIQEAKDLKTLSLDELIANLQIYELRRNSEQQEETKKHRGLALKIMEEDSSDLDEDMAMLARKFKKFFKKTKAGTRQKQPSRSKNTDRDQFTGCFKCGKMDHMIKNCPQLKEEHELESPKRLFRKKGGNSSGKKFTRAMLAAWGDSTDEEEGSEEEEKGAVALMARSKTDSDEESSDSLIRLKNKVSGLNKTKLKEFLLVLIDECEALHTENCDLRDECDELKRDIKELEHENKILQDEKIKLDMNNLVLHEDLARVKEILRLKEENFVNSFTKLEKESLDLRQKIESLLVENQNLHEKLKQVEIDQVANKRWLDSSNAWNWLNTHHNRGRK